DRLMTRVRALGRWCQGKHECFENTFYGVSAEILRRRWELRLRQYGHCLIEPLLGDPRVLSGVNILGRSHDRHLSATLSAGSPLPKTALAPSPPALAPAGGSSLTRIPPP